MRINLKHQFVFIFLMFLSFKIFGQDTIITKKDTIINILITDIKSKTSNWISYSYNNTDSVLRVYSNKLDSFVTKKAIKIDSLNKKITSYLDSTFLPFKKKIKKKHLEKKQEIANFYNSDLECLEDLKATKESSKLEEVINIRPEVATHQTLSIRNMPSIISIITAEDIRKSGARDLIDILKLIPNFHFAADEQGNIGLGVRGNWSNEGKVLMLIDGIEVNNNYTGKLNFGNRYPVNIIKQIEIIRGSGSSNYGGFAGFAVINIITYNAENKKGLDIYLGNGFTGDMFAHNQFGIYYGKKWKNFSLDIKSYFGAGQRSNRNQFSFYDINEWGNLGIGKVKSLKNNSSIEPSTLAFTLKYKNWKYISYSDDYKVQDITHLDTLGNINNFIRNKTTQHQLSYNWKINEKLIIKPKLDISLQVKETEGKTNDDFNLDDDLNLISEENSVARIKFSTLAHYNKTHRQNWTFGVENFVDIYNQKDDTSSYGEPYRTIALFSQVIFKLPFWNVTLGGRIEDNSIYGFSIVPRIGATKRIHNFNLKCMITTGYRTPTIGNILHSFNGIYQINADSTNIYIPNLTKNLKPEIISNFEFEIGYKVNKKLLLKANIFDIDIDNPIVFYTYSDKSIRNFYTKNNGFVGKQMYGLNVYQNFESAGTKGVEFEVKFKDVWGSLDMNYSFYSVKDEHVNPAYSVSEFNFDAKERMNNIYKESSVLAFPKHQFMTRILVNLTEDVSIHYNINCYGVRYAHNAEVYEDDTYPVAYLKRYSPSFISDIYFNVENLFWKGFRFGIGIYDIFNSNYKYVQAQFAYNVEIPRTSRECFFKITYNFHVKKECKQN